MMNVPAKPKIYHIVHVDRLHSIIADGALWSDAEALKKKLPGTQIGMDHIKARRLKELTLNSHSDLHVGECVPFYFCPRSIMLYILSQGNSQQLNYKGGQEPIVHLVADLYDAINWSEINNRRWVFTLSNAGSNDFDDRNDISQLKDINWGAVCAKQWSGNNVDSSIRRGKQAEFLVEISFPWSLFELIGVNTAKIQQQVISALSTASHKPKVTIERAWYY